MLQNYAAACPLLLYPVFGCVGNLVNGMIFGAKLILPSEKYDTEAVLKAILDEKVISIGGNPVSRTRMEYELNLRKKIASGVPI